MWCVIIRRWFDCRIWKTLASPFCHILFSIISQRQWSWRNPLANWQLKVKIPTKGLELSSSSKWGEQLYDKTRLFLKCLIFLNYKRKTSIIKFSGIPSSVSIKPRKGYLQVANFTCGLGLTTALRKPPALRQHPHFYYEILRYNKLQMGLVIFSLVFLERQNQTSLLNLFHLLNWFSYFQGLNHFGRKSRCCVIALSFSGAAAEIIPEQEPHCQRWSFPCSSAKVKMTGKPSHFCLSA